MPRGFSVWAFTKIGRETIAAAISIFIVLFIAFVLFGLNKNGVVLIVASILEASPNAVFPDTVSAHAFRVSIDLYHLGKYFGEIPEIRIKKSTLPYVVLCLSVYPLIVRC